MNTAQKREVGGARALVIAAGLAAVLGAGAAIAEPCRVVIPVAGHLPTGGTTTATADVPGMPGATYNNFQRSHRSHGNLWISVPTISFTGSTGATDQVVLIGTGVNYNVIAQEGVATVDGSGTLLNIPAGITPMVNDSGEWALAFTSGGAWRVVKKTASGYSTLAVAGGAANGIAPGATWGTSGTVFSSASITNDGEVSFQADGVVDPNFVVPTRLNVRDNGNAIVSRTFVTAPTNQPGGGNDVFTATNFGATSIAGFFVSADGQHTAYFGDLASGTRVAVKDNAVVLHVGAQLTGPTDLVTSITEMWMESNGDLFIRGNAGSPATAYLWRNGTVVARVGQPLFPGSTENWTALTEYKGNNHGQWMVLGTSNNPTSALNKVAVLSSQRVIGRSGDPIAFDGDGLFNDGRHIHAWQNNRSFFGNDGYFYTTVQMRDAEQGSIVTNNGSLVRFGPFDIPQPAAGCQPADIASDDGTPLPTDLNLHPNGGVNEGDYNSFFQGFFDAAPNCDIANDDGSPRAPFGTNGTNGGVNEGDYNCFFQKFFDGCPA